MYIKIRDAWTRERVLRHIHFQENECQRSQSFQGPEEPEIELELGACIALEKLWYLFVPNFSPLLNEGTMTNLRTYNTCKEMCFKCNQLLSYLIECSIMPDK